MKSKIKRYVVFNKATGAVVTPGDNLKTLTQIYFGDVYEICEVKPIGRNEW